jgi:hypothetical protein
MKQMPNEELIQILLDAVRLRLDNEFIHLIADEFRQRQLALPIDLASIVAISLQNGYSEEN